MFPPRCRSLLSNLGAFFGAQLLRASATTSFAGFDLTGFLRLCFRDLTSGDLDGCANHVSGTLLAFRAFRHSQSSFALR